MHQSTTPSLSQTIWPRWVSTQFLIVPIVQTLLPETFAYFLSSEAVVIRQLRRRKRLWRRSLSRSHKRTSMGPSRSCWNGTRSSLLQVEITTKGTRGHLCTINKSAHTKKSLETYRMHLVIPWKMQCDRILLYTGKFWSRNARAKINKWIINKICYQLHQIYISFVHKNTHLCMCVDDYKCSYTDIYTLWIFKCICVCVCVWLTSESPC